MKTWDEHTEKERAEMSEADVTAFCQAALMEAGVLKPREPEYKEVESARPELTETYFEIHGLLFASIDDANTVADLACFKDDYDYNVGYDYRFASPCDPAQPKEKHFANRNTISTMRETLIRIKEAKAHNDKEQTRFRKESDAAGEVTGFIWEDYSRCQGLAREYAAVMATYEEYQTMSQGDAKTAFKFLCRAYSVGTVQAAFEWFDRSSECVFAVTPGEAPVEVDEDQPK